MIESDRVCVCVIYSASKQIVIMDKLNYSKCPLKKRPILVKEPPLEDQLCHGKFVDPPQNVEVCKINAHLFLALLR